MQPMKINATIIDDQLQVGVFVRVPNLHARPEIVDFVLDTGSNRSFIGCHDCAILNLPVGKTKFIEHMRIGGSVFSLHALPTITLAFESDQGKALIHAEFHIAVPTKKSKSAFEEALHLPSIIGLDFLREHSMSLYAHPAENEAYLQK